MSIQILQSVINYVQNSSLCDFITDHYKWVNDGVIFVLRENNGSCNVNCIRRVLESFDSI